MNFEILFRDGTKLHLVGYELHKEDADSAVLLKKDANEVVTIFKKNVSYLYAKTS